MNILFLLIGLVVGAGIGWLLGKLLNKAPVVTDNGSEEQLRTIESDNKVLKDRLKNAEEVFKEQKKEIEDERTKVINLSTENARLKSEHDNISKKLEEQKGELEQIQKKFTTEFQNIANKLLEEKSEKFTQQNKTNLDIILNPLKDKIKEFEQKVENTHKEDLKERSSLKAEIKSLVELNKQISEEANNLAKALKGDNKMQGNWGEVILEKVLERSGLEKGEEYDTQFSTENNEGKRIQPDVVVKLPDNKHIIIDSKVSLIAYEQLVNTEDTDERSKYIKDHILSLRNHIKILSEKNYQTSSDLSTPDFVLLFVPIEASFSIAVQADQELFNYAWDRKIVIVSPSTLLATLRTIASVWKQEKQNRNAQEIAEQSGRLYDKFVGFVEDLNKVGKNLSITQKAYDDSIKKLHTGTGSLVSRVEKIRKLGAKNTKAIPLNLIDQEESDEQEND